MLLQYLSQRQLKAASMQHMVLELPTADTTLLRKVMGYTKQLELSRLVLVLLHIMILQMLAVGDTSVQHLPSKKVLHHSHKKTLMLTQMDTLPLHPLQWITLNFKTIELSSRTEILFNNLNLIMNSQPQMHTTVLIT